MEMKEKKNIIVASSIKVCWFAKVLLKILLNVTRESTTWRILHKDLALKSHTVQRIYEFWVLRRCLFVFWIKEQPDTLKNSFSD